MIDEKSIIGNGGSSGMVRFYKEKHIRFCVDGVGGSAGSAGVSNSGGIGAQDISRSGGMGRRVAGH